jgi:hypothetical protein
VKKKALKFINVSYSRAYPDFIIDRKVEYGITTAISLPQEEQRNESDWDFESLPQLAQISTVLGILYQNRRNILTI